MAPQPLPPSRTPSTEELAAVAVGDAPMEVALRVEDAARRDPAIAAALGRMRLAVDAVRAECTAARELEPPQDAVARARALGARVAARKGHSPTQIVTLGNALDAAGAAIVSWLGLAQGGGASAAGLAGFRDDRGADAVAGSVGGLMLRAERIEAEDGTERLIGAIERTGAGDGAMRGTIAALGAGQTVLACAELDPFGIFTLAVPAGTARIALVHRTGEVVLVIEWPTRSER